MFEQFFLENEVASYVCFFVFAIIVAGLATLVTKFSVSIKDKAKLPDGVIGGILIGAVTSIPELITAIGYIINSTTIPDYGNPGAVFGDVIGSNMFCMLIIGVACIATVWIFRQREANQINTIIIVCLIVGSVLCLLAVLFDNNGLVYNSINPSPLVWHGFNLFSLLIFISYIFEVIFMIIGEKVAKPAGVVGKGLKTQTTLPTIEVKQSIFTKPKIGILIVLLLVSIACLTFASLVLAGSTSGCIVRWFPGNNIAFGRTLLLGIATGLPELITVITIAISKRYNMMINSMVGSCGFNMLILFVCNIVYSCLWKEGVKPMFPKPEDQNSVMVQVVLFILMCVFFALYLILNSKSIKAYLNKKQVLIVNISLLSLVVFSYFGYIALGIIQKNSL